MKFFCSKDCPDLCEFEIELKNNKLYFKPVKRNFDSVPFVCTKLKDFYDMEHNDCTAFYKSNNKKFYCDNDEAIEKCSNYLKSVKNERILFLRGSGSLGYMMYYWDLFMSKFENCYFIDGNPCDETGTCANEEDFGCSVNPPHNNLEKVDTIFIFGRNARNVSPHFYSYLKKLKKSGKRIYYMDPVKMPTYRVADKYIRISPGTDGILAAGLLSKLNDNFNVSLEYVLEKTGISEDNFNLLFSEIKPEKTGFIVGFGLQRYTNGKNTVQWINRLAVFSDNIDNLYYGRSSKGRFMKPDIRVKHKIAVTDVVDKISEGYFNTVVVVGANPAVTFPNTNLWTQALTKTNLIVVDVKYSKTVEFADFFIKAGGMFAQEDVMGSYFFNVEASRKKFSDSMSDTEIISKLSEKLNFDIKIPSVTEIKPVVNEPERKFVNNKIEIKLPVFEKDKFRLITSSHVLYLNSQVPDKYKDIDNFVFINPVDAIENNISDNEKIELKGENGSLQIKAKISDIVAKGILLVYKSRVSNGYASNVLTNNIATDAGTGIAYYDTFVKINKR